MWRAIIEDDVKSAMNPAEVSALTVKLKAIEDPDPLGKIIQQVTATFRDAVRSSGKNRLTVDETLVPEGAIFYLVPLIRQRLFSRFNIGELSDDRKTEYEDSTSYLKDVRRGDAMVEDPFKDESASKPVPTPSLSINEREYRWGDQDGV